MRTARILKHFVVDPILEGNGVSILAQVWFLVAIFFAQETSSRRREMLRLETETELRNRRMELERELDATKLQVRTDYAQNDKTNFRLNLARAITLKV